MSGEANYLDVKIMGREYRVACAPDEQPALQAAVDLVDGKMREVAQRTRNTVAERVAVMAALNIAHDLLSARKEKTSDESSNEGLATSELKRRITDMGARLDAVLAPQPEAEEQDLGA